MTRRLLLFALLLTACAQTPAVVPLGYNPESAARYLDQLTADARVVATQGAQATAARVGTEQAIADVMTLAAVTQGAAQTALAATPTAAALAFAMTATPAAAASQDRATAVQVSVTQAALMAGAERKRLDADRNFWLATGGLVLLMIVLLVGLAGILYQAERLLSAIATEREVRAGKLAIVMLASGLSYDTRSQLLIDGPVVDGELVDAKPRTYKTRDADGSEREVELPVTDAERLLIAAVRAGYGAAARIPSAAQVGWPGERRGAAVKSLGGAVETHYGSPANGGGTYIHSRWGTVAALLGAIQAGQVIPTAPPPQPEPAREGAKVSA